MMEIRTIPVGIYGANCYLVIYKDKCAIIDPGADGDNIINIIEKLKLQPQYIILTHGHMDHVGAVEKVKDKYNVPIYINEKDQNMINNIENIFGNFGKYKAADRYIREGEIIELGDLNIECIETPGHTPGGMCFKINDIVFTGDTLFRDSIGRTDFVGGDHASIIESIKNKLMKLDDDTKVLPGHGPVSSIGYERRENPFF